MNKSAHKLILAALILTMLASACGNKGPLVKPDEKLAEAEAAK